MVREQTLGDENSLFPSAHSRPQWPPHQLILFCSSVACSILYIGSAAAALFIALQKYYEINNNIIHRVTIYTCMPGSGIQFARPNQHIQTSNTYTNFFQ